MKNCPNTYTEFIIVRVVGIADTWLDTQTNTNTNTEFMIVSGGYIADTGLATQTPRQH